MCPFKLQGVLIVKRFAENEYVIWLEFDEDITNFFNKKCAMLDRYKIKQGVRPPHMTLTFVKTNCINEVIKYTKSFFSKNNICISLMSVEMFKNRVVYYAPQKSEKLFDFQKRFCIGLIVFGKLSWKLYLPERWTPHIALTGNLSKKKSAEAVSIITEGFLPIKDIQPKKAVIKNCYSGEIVLNLNI